MCQMVGHKFYETLITPQVPQAQMVLLLWHYVEHGRWSKTDWHDVSTGHGYTLGPVPVSIPDTGMPQHGGEYIQQDYQDL